MNDSPIIKKALVADQVKPDPTPTPPVNDMPQNAHDSARPPLHHQLPQAGPAPADKCAHCEYADNCQALPRYGQPLCGLGSKRLTHNTIGHGYVLLDGLGLPDLLQAAIQRLGELEDAEERRRLCLRRVRESEVHP